MRIGMMADLYKPHISGVTNFIALNKQHLEAAGHQVYVFTFGVPDDYEDDEINIIRSPGISVLDTGFHFSVRYTKEAQRLLRTMDVVHVHHPFLSGTLALLYCRPRGIPIIFTNHTRYDLYAQAYFPGMPEVVGLAALQTYLPAFCRSCDLVISPSASVRDILAGLSVDCEIDVVPNGVDLAPFSQPCESDMRAALGYSPEDVVLLYVGRLGIEKNVPFLLRSFAGAAQAFDTLRLLIIGGGSERENLQDRVALAHLEDRVKFLGPVPYDDIPCYMQAADAFVTASVTEVHPLTVIEAMAAGLPVLGIQSPGISDTVEDCVTGYLAPEVDLAAFTARMVRLALEPEERRQMGEQARQVARQYAIERTMGLMLERYQRVVRQSARRKRTWRARLDRWMDRLRA